MDRHIFSNVVLIIVVIVVYFIAVIAVIVVLITVVVGISKFPPKHETIGMAGRKTLR